MYIATLKSEEYLNYSFHKTVNHWSVGMSFEVDSVRILNRKGDIPKLIAVDDVPCPSSWWDIVPITQNKEVLNKARLSDEDKASLVKYVRYLKKPFCTGDCLNIELGEFSIKNNRLADEYNNQYAFRSASLKLNANSKRNKAVTLFIMKELGYEEKPLVSNISDSTDIKMVHSVTGKVATIKDLLILRGSNIFDSTLLAELNKIDNDVSTRLLLLNAYWYHPDGIRNFTLIDKHSKLRFLPDGKKDISTNYQEMKVGKVFKKLGITQFPPSTIEKFVNSMLALDDNNLNWKTVKGKDIAKYYHEDHHDNSNTGSLGKSCMKHPSCQSYFDIYTKNPDVCQMLLLLTPNKKVLGRALLWTANCGTLLMDRAYGNDATIQKFKNWAKNNGRVHKYYQSHCEKSTWDIGTGKSSRKYYEIDIDVDHRKYPYLDTFSHIHGNIISNRDIPNRIKLISARSTKGTGVEKIVWVKEFDTGIKLIKQEAVRIKELKGFVHFNRTYSDHITGYQDLKENFTLIGLERVHSSNIAKCELDNKKCHVEYIKVLLDGRKINEEHTKYSSNSGGYILRTDAIESYYSGWIDKTTDKYFLSEMGCCILKRNEEKYKERVDRSLTATEKKSKNY